MSGRPRKYHYDYGGVTDPAERKRIRTRARHRQLPRPVWLEIVRKSAEAYRLRLEVVLNKALREILSQHRTNVKGRRKYADRLAKLVSGPEESRLSAARRTRRSDLLKLYGMSEDDYQKMLRDQRGRCAICKLESTSLSRWGTVKALAVDHDHGTKRVRGLLCDKCNRGLGYFNDNVDLLRSATEYLRHFDASSTSLKLVAGGSL